MAARVKVKVEYTKKTFYERLLTSWKESVDDRKLKFVLYKAVQNLKSSPFDVDGVAQLKIVKGIGDHIAVKCEEAWQLACDEKNSELSLEDVKSLDFEELVRTAQIHKRDPKRVPPGADSEKGTKARKGVSSQPIRSVPTSSSGLGSKQTDEFADGDDEFVGEKPPAATTSRCLLPSLTSMPPPSSSSSLTSDDNESDCLLLTSLPLDQSQVILLTDSREHRSGRFKSVVEHLVSQPGLRVDMRPLSIGDYLWVAKKIDGSEIVMDWVVERKTWQDLHSSIRGGRYDEQKERMGRAPIRNRVYLIEGRSPGEVPNEQALVSTMTNGGFLVQRCANAKETADFLGFVARRLQELVDSQKVEGVSFDHLQKMMKKQKAETVKESWIRQLMVCPGMSYSRAAAIADRFPSMTSLLNLYLTSPGDGIELMHIVPQVTRPIAKNLRKFFVG